MTDRDFELTAARQANPRPAGTGGPESEWSATELLSQIEHRSDTTETIERDPRTTKPSGPTRTPGWLLAAAVAALVVLVGAIAIGLQRNSGTDVVEPAPTTVPTPTTAPPTTATPAIDRSPLEVMDLYNESVAGGDWAAVRELYAGTAELEVRGANETFVPLVPLADYEPRTSYDWDGDGLNNGFDGVIEDSARVHAHGTTAFISCTEADATIVVCDEVWEGHAFKVPNVEPTTWTLTIVDGFITTHVLQLVERENPVDTDLVRQYKEWVADNRPDLERELFVDNFTLNITPDGVLIHRELVAEWQAQLPAKAFEATVTWDGETCTYEGPAMIASGDQLTVTYTNASEADEILGYEVGLLEPGSTLADYAGFYDPAPADYGWPGFVTLIDTFPTGLDSVRNDLALPDRVGVGESGDETLGALLPLEPGLYGFACLSDIPPDWQVSVAQTGIEVTE